MAVNGTITRNPNGTLRFTTRCMFCKQPVAVDQLDPAQFTAWKDGALAQDAFPGMSDAEREALVSGSHAKCFAEAFAEEDEDEDPEDPWFDVEEYDEQQRRESGE